MAEPELDGVSAEIADVFANASDILDEAAESLATFTDEAKDSRPALHRADSAIAYGRVQVGLANPKIIPRNIADEIQDSAAGLRNQLSQAVADEGGDIGSAADVFLASLSRLRLPDLTEETAMAAADRFRKSLNPRLAKLKAEMGRIEERVNQVSQISGEQAEALPRRKQLCRVIE